jgi:hypothetical protein
MSSTTGYSGPSVPMTNGYSGWVAEPGVEIWRTVGGGSGTADAPARMEKVYPMPSEGKSGEAT